MDLLGIGLIAWGLGYGVPWVANRFRRPAVPDLIEREYAEKRRVLERDREEWSESSSGSPDRPFFQRRIDAMAKLDQQLIELAEEERMAREVASERRRDHDDDKE